MIQDNLLEIHEYKGEGYVSLVHFKSWRVAVLRYCDELLPQNIKKLQRHNETDEIFVLLAGSCTLFLADGADTIGEIYAQQLLPLKVYNVKKGAWHSHTLSKEATVLIIESDDTYDNNSPEQALTQVQRQKLIELTAKC